MAQPRKLSAKDVMAEIKAGTDDAGLMAKYELSSANLRVLFTKLVSHGLLSESELDRRRAGVGAAASRAVPCPVCGKPLSGEGEQCVYCQKTAPKVEPIRVQEEPIRDRPAETAVSPVVEESSDKKQAFRSGANWFFWIAGLSLVNSAIIMFGGQWNFIVGLGITQFVDGMVLFAALDGAQASIILKVVCGAINLAITGMFALFGVLALKRHTWAFITGMAIYALDGLLFLFVGDYLAVGFHAFALFFLFRGFQAMRELKAAY
jgi:hypothetical protein